MLSRTDKYFLTIVKTGSLSRAAEQLYVSQPSLSKYIKRLEAQLEAPLFDRSVNPMRLTECGILYLRYLQNLIDSEQQLLNQISEIQDHVRGTLRLGIPSFCGQCFLPQVLPLFSKEFPNVSIELYEKTGMKIEQALLNQEIDLAVLHSPIIHETLSLMTIAQERIFVAVQRTADQLTPAHSDGLLLREGTISDIMGKPIILPQVDQKLNRVALDFLRQFQYQPNVYTRTENVVTTLELVAQGLGIGFVPESGLHTVSEAILGQLIFFIFPYHLSDWQLVAVTRQGSFMSPFAKRFVELLSDCAQRRHYVQKAPNEIQRLTPYMSPP